MAQQVINIGPTPNDGQGTPLRNSFDITNQNFTENYGSIGTISSDIVTINNKIGPGAVYLDAGDTVDPITTIDLSLANTQAVKIVSNTTFNFTNQEEGRNYTLIPYYDAGSGAKSVNFPNNFKFSGDTSIALNSGPLLNSSFDVGVGFDNEPYVFAYQPDGKVICGGGFNTYNGISAPKIVRLNTDGSVDTTFVYGYAFNGQVRAVSIQPDGKIVVGGAFGNYNGSYAPKIIRLNADGSHDTTFNPSAMSSGFNGDVRALVLQPDGKILVGGEFTTYNGVTVNRIVRLNTNGSEDFSFNNTTTSTGFTPAVTSIALQSDGNIVVGGYFSSYDGFASPYIIRLTSTGGIDYSFNVGTSLDGNPETILIQPDGKIVCVGWFSTYNGQLANRIIRLNTDGSADTTFVTGTGFSGGAVKGCAIDPTTGNLYFGGGFSSYNGAVANYAISLTPTGAVNTGWDNGSAWGMPGGMSYSELGLMIFIPAIGGADASILVGGYFNGYYENGGKHIVSLATSPGKVYYKLDLVAHGTDIIANF